MKSACLVSLFLMIAFAAAAQGVRRPNPARTPAPASSDPQFGQQRNNDGPYEKQIERERARQLNKDRQAALKRDTDKLLTLATELKEYVDKTNENVLSLEVLRKAEQIEKLAHSVKEKMKD